MLAESHSIVHHMNLFAILTATAAALSAVLTIVSFTKKGRGWWKEWAEHRRKKKAMPDAICKIGQDIELMKGKQEFFAKELTANGGNSLKDEVRMLVRERMLEVKEALYPAFRSNDNGENVFVNRAFAILCGTDDETLLGLGWMGFMDTPKTAEEIHGRWKKIAKTKSHFSEDIVFRDVKGAPRGVWVVKANPIGSYGDHGEESDKKSNVWCGRFFPVDDVAKKIAREHHWRFVF